MELFRSFLPWHASKGQELVASPGDETKLGSAAAQTCIVLTAKTPLLSMEQVGGKAHNLIKLFRMGVPVPETCVITCDEYARNSNNGTLSKATLATLEEYLKKDVHYAVRSSASCEDGADSAFAGRFTTELNVPGDLTSITAAVIKCWASMKAPDLAGKLTHNAQMGVVVMRQVDSKRSGVLFQANPITSSPATHIITASYGQGEGVVGGRVPVDTYSLKEATLEIRSKVLAKKTTMLVLDSVAGTKEVEVAQELQDIACLTDVEIVEVAKAGKVIRSKCLSPQDIEFCFDESKKLYILQTRPITTLAETLEWKAPQPGLYQLNGHLATPISEFYGPCWMYGHSVGAKENTDLMGMGIVKVDTCIINGFAYFCMRNPGPKAAPKALPPPIVLRTIIRLTGGKAIKQAKKFWTEKLWRSFVKDEYPKLKMSWRQQMVEWKAKVEASHSLSDKELANLLKEAQQWGGEMYRAHANVTMYNLAPVAHFVMSIVEATGCPAVDGFSCIDGCSAISLGYVGEFPDQIATVAADSALTAELLDVELSNDSDVAKNKWREFQARRGDSTGLVALMEILDAVQYRLADGYDSANDTLWECPQLVFTGVADALKKYKEDGIANARKRSDAAAARLLERVQDPSKRKELEEMLDEARMVASLRDERAILTDLTACGIIHHLLLEVGRRLGARAAARGETVDERLLLLASLEEMQTHLNTSDAPPMTFWEELQRRKTYREKGSIMDAPPFIGGVMLKPSLEHFPHPLMARSVHNVIWVIDQIFAAPDLEETSATGHGIQNDKNVIVGFSGSKGVTKGRARLVLDAKDAAKLQPGEICVTKYPSSVINLILGKASGIVTDLGGVLCHAAICAREAEIPCVIGCHTATIRIKNGDLIEVDGNTGMVRIMADEGPKAS